jgi:hypothetical protein
MLTSDCIVDRRENRHSEDMGSLVLFVWVVEPSTRYDWQESIVETSLIRKRDVFIDLVEAR